MTYPTNTVEQTTPCPNCGVTPTVLIEDFEWSDALEQWDLIYEVRYCPTCDHAWDSESFINASIEL